LPISELLTVLTRCTAIAPASPNSAVSGTWPALTTSEAAVKPMSASTLSPFAAIEPFNISAALSWLNTCTPIATPNAFFGASSGVPPPGSSGGVL